MSKQYCPAHEDIVLVRMHINPNQAKKYNIPFSTKFWFCHKCNLPYEVIPRETMVLIKSETKPKRKIRSDKGISRR